MNKKYFWIIIATILTILITMLLVIYFYNQNKNKEVFKIVNEGFYDNEAFVSEFIAPSDINYVINFKYLDSRATISYVWYYYDNNEYNAVYANSIIPNGKTRVELIMVDEENNFFHKGKYKIEYTLFGRGRKLQETTKEIIYR